MKKLILPLLALFLLTGCSRVDINSPTFLESIKKCNSIGLNLVTHSFQGGEVLYCDFQSPYIININK